MQFLTQTWVTVSHSGSKVLICFICDANLGTFVDIHVQLFLQINDFGTGKNIVQYFYQKKNGGQIELP